MVAPLLFHRFFGATRYRYFWAQTINSLGVNNWFPPFTVCNFCLLLIISDLLRFFSSYQRIQNTLARIVLQTDSLTHSEPLLQQLHWLPVHSRIRFKLATITYKALSTNSPQYLASLIHYHQPVRSLRSSDQHYLFPTPSRINFSCRSFRYSAPAIWNPIPLETRSSPIPRQPFTPSNAT